MKVNAYSVQRIQVEIDKPEIIYNILQEVDLDTLTEGLLKRLERKIIDSYNQSSLFKINSPTANEVEFDWNDLSQSRIVHSYVDPRDNKRHSIKLRKLNNNEVEMIKIIEDLYKLDKI